LSAEYCLPLFAKTDPPRDVPVTSHWTHPAARSLCDSWGTCFISSSLSSNIQT